MRLPVHGTGTGPADCAAAIESRERKKNVPAQVGSGQVQLDTQRSVMWPARPASTSVMSLADDPPLHLGVGRNIRHRVIKSTTTTSRNLHNRRYSKSFVGKLASLALHEVRAPRLLINRLIKVGQV